MSKENINLHAHASDNTITTYRKLLKEMGTTKYCQICHQDMTGTTYKVKKSHAWSHLVIFSCDCGFMRSKDYLIKLHHQKEHPGMPFIYYKTDWNSWDKVKELILALPLCMPPLPWNHQHEEPESDLDTEHELPEVTVILKEMTQQMPRLSPIRDLVPSRSHIALRPRSTSPPVTTKPKPYKKKYCKKDR